MRFLWVRALVWSFCLFISVSASSAQQSDEGFCADLKAVGAEAKAGFMKFRGAPLGPTDTNKVTGWSETKFATSRKLLGALSCDVNEGRHPKYGVSTYYECSFAPGPRKVETVFRIAKEIVSCTGIKPSASDLEAIEEDDAEDYAMLDLPARGFKVNVSSIPSPSGVRVSILPL
jgi:hypothetical protein